MKNSILKRLKDEPFSKFPNELLFTVTNDVINKKINLFLTTVELFYPIIKTQEYLNKQLT